MDRIYSKNSFDRFGDDLCEVLLSELCNDSDGGLRDRLKYESVCKQWRTVIFNTQTYLDYSYVRDCDLTTFETILRKCVNITTLRAIGGLKGWYITDTKMQSIIKHCDHVTNILKMSWDDSISLKTMEIFFVKYAKQLKSLGLSIDHGDENYECIKIKRLFIKNNLKIAIIYSN